MRRIRVGLPLVPKLRGYQEGVHYNYTPGGHTLTISMKEPTSPDVEAVRRGQASFALICREEAIFILSRFGHLPWKVSHYNWWINPPVMRPDPWADMERLNGGVATSVCLVNASDGVVAALRVVTLSHELSRLLLELVQVQARPPFDPWRYLDVVEQTCAESLKPERLLRETLCMCVADFPEWDSFDAAGPDTVQ
jgi:hypothetical protein